MRRVYCDFNERMENDAHIVLFIDERRIEDCDPVEGERLILFQDEGDFEVEGVLSFRGSEWFGRPTWTAFPDWQTLVRFDQV